MDCELAHANVCAAAMEPMITIPGESACQCTILCAAVMEPMMTIPWGNRISIHDPMCCTDGPTSGPQELDCAIDDFLDGAPQFRHSSMPCLSRGQARAMPIVRNCSCICEQPVTILTQKGLPFNTKTLVDLSVQNAPPSDAKECLTS